MRPARSASTSTRSAAGAASAAAARSSSPKASSPSTASRPVPTTSPRSASPRPATANDRASPPTGASGATRASPATSSSTCRRRASCIGRSCARRPTRIRSRSIRSCGCTTSRCASPISPTRAATCSACARRSSATGGSRDSPVIRTCSRRCNGPCAATTGRPRSPCTTATTITATWPGFHDVALGVAFDVGSTTVAGHLCDLQTGEVLASAGAMNPQIRFGEDLMSRVSYVMMHPGSEAELTAAIRTCVDGLIADLCAQAGADATDVLELTIVGNPIMHHLFLGLDPTELGGAPFALATDEAVHRSARELDLTTTNAGARVYVLPCIAGHVGADTAGVILSEAPHDQDTVNLIVDVGTNAEIVLGNRDRLLAASSPTGPAFEGAQICCGQRAAPGAIERVRIDRETLEPRFRVIGDDRWSDEPGFDAVLRDRGRGQRHHRGDRGALPGRRDHHRRRDRRLARRPQRSHRRRRADVLLRAARCARGPAPRDHAERRAADPAREGSSVRGVPPADGCPRHRDRRPDPAGRRVRRPHRPRARDGPRARARLRPRARHERRERRRHRRPHRAAEPGRARRDRGRRATRGEAGDRGGTAVPGALRRGDGHPARHRPVPAAGRRRRLPPPRTVTSGDRPRRRRRTSDHERSST